MFRPVFILALAMVALGSCATPSPPRADASGKHSAKLAAFEAALAAQDSATKALEGWCAAQALANPATVTARKTGDVTPPPPGLRARLQIGAAEPLGYRHVILSCGTRALSIAHNWYVPGRLGPEMEHQLATTDVPFGKVAAPLSFRREPIEVLFDPPPECPRPTISAHRALLRLPDGRPLAYVVECYTPENLAGRR